VHLAHRDTIILLFSCELGFAVNFTDETAVRNILQTTGGKNCYLLTNRLITAKPALLTSQRASV